MGRGIYAIPSAAPNADRATETKTSGGRAGVSLKPGDPGFLEAGKESGVWLSIPEAIYDEAREHYADDPQKLEEALRKLDVLQKCCDDCNTFLGRSDVEDGAKQRFINKFMVNQDVDDYDNPTDLDTDADKAGVFATMLAKLFDPQERFSVVLDDVDSALFDDAVTLDEMNAMASLFDDARVTWMDTNKVDLEEDTTWKEFAQASVLASEIEERRKDMTINELLADIDRVREERSEAIRKSNRSFA